ncbi:MAG: electron transfer flavoprotein subunit alpha/FixB family protein [Desulfobacterales bacterium]|nr:electron transfer flavoprotein subunit alpha/FixB family protein [Desulfobacterales bacterium]
MSKTGVLIEIENNAVKETSLGVMAAAAGTDIYAIVMDADAAAVQPTLAEYGASVVVSVQEDTAGSPDIAAAALAAAAKEYELTGILGTASAMGKDIFARAAAMTDQPLVSDALSISLVDKTATKSHFSGKTMATLDVDADIFLCTIRPNVYEAAAAQAAGELVEFAPGVSDTPRVKVVEVKKGDSDKLDLTEAPVVVAGGRAVDAAENFSMLDACAAKLGAAVGASRAAVDAGFAPHSMQVGQTGKTVSPKLYLACGVSGAVQHFAGMKTSKVIVAINDDKDAPIFAKCDYGIVGDIFEVVPKLTEKL